MVQLNEHVSVTETHGVRAVSQKFPQDADVSFSKHNCERGPWLPACEVPGRTIETKCGFVTYGFGVDCDHISLLSKGFELAPLSGISDVFRTNSSEVRHLTRQSASCLNQYVAPTWDNHMRVLPEKFTLLGTSGYSSCYRNINATPTGPFWDTKYAHFEHFKIRGESYFLHVPLNRCRLERLFFGHVEPDPVRLAQGLSRTAFLDEYTFPLIPTPHGVTMSQYHLLDFLTATRFHAVRQGVPSL